MLCGVYNSIGAQLFININKLFLNKRMQFKKNICIFFLNWKLFYRYIFYNMLNI